MTDGTLYPGRRGLEGLCHLRIQNLGDGVDHVHVIDGDDDGFAQVLIAFDVGRDTDLVDDGVPNGPPTGLLRTATKQEIFRSGLLLSLLVNAPMLHRACSTIIVNSNIKVKFRTNKHLKKVFSE